MLIEGNTLVRIDKEDIIDGVFVAPDEVLYIGDYLVCDNVIKMILPNVIEIGDNFMKYNRSLEYLYIPKVEKIRSYFLFVNKVLSKLVMPNIKEIGYNFLFYNDSLIHLDIPNIIEIGSGFLGYNTRFRYTSGIIKALKYNMYIDGRIINKREYLRKLKINKFLTQ